MNSNYPLQKLEETALLLHSLIGNMQNLSTQFETIENTLTAISLDPSNKDGNTAKGLNTVEQKFSTREIENSTQIQEVSQNFNSNDTDTSLVESPGNLLLFIKKRNTLTRLELRQILYVEVNGKHSRIATLVGNFLIQKSLKDLQRVFSFPLFLRVHRNYLINLKSVKRILLDDHNIELGDGHFVPLSQNFKTLLLDSILLIK